MWDLDHTAVIGSRSPVVRDQHVINDISRLLPQKGVGIGTESGNGNALLSAPLMSLGDYEVWTEVTAGQSIDVLSCP